MKKLNLVSKAAVVFGLVLTSMVGSYSASAATTDQVKRACKNAFEGKCLHGGTVDTSNFFAIEQVQDYCAQSTYCSLSECTTRLAVILGFGASVDDNGNPCLPTN
jgi:hypothetical protein